ncbi:MAG: bestrophin family ion channel [Flavobacterium circumlabens]|uniref:bestrophin family protein n=1 Tax=Flavobacterium circumlabens TaxID=2133765 RepID=UPI00326491E8
MLVKNNKSSIVFFIKSIWVDIAAIMTYALVIGTLDHNTILREIAIPLPITSIMGTIVGLLLAFRTAQSYDRWWEARKVWGEIVNDSRTLIRQVRQFMPESENDLKEFAQRQVIWCFALSESLRKIPFSHRVESYLEQHNIMANNVPAELLNRHADQLAMISKIFSINDNKQVQIDTTIARLNDAMGKCERIKNTVFPKSYSLLIHFLIYLLTSILPFGLEDSFPALEIVLTLVISSMLIAVEKTAIIMQDPFENSPTDIPMTALCEVIENNIKEICSDIAVPPVQRNSYYYIN